MISIIKRLLFGEIWVDANGYTWKKDHGYWVAQMNKNTDNETHATWVMYRHFDENAMNESTRNWRSIGEHSS